MNFRDVGIKKKMCATFIVLAVFAFIVIYIFVNAQLDAMKDTELLKAKKLLVDALEGNDRKKTILTKIIPCHSNSYDFIGKMKWSNPVPG